VTGFNKGKCACGNWQTSKGRVKGRTYYDRYCSTCKRNRRIISIKRKKLTCEICGFKAKYPAQMDIDHIDGNHKDNSPENLQEICANCHRLKTIQEKDWMKQQDKVEVADETSYRTPDQGHRDYLRSLGYVVSDKGRLKESLIQVLIDAGFDVIRYKK
jgi:hypothetical protein